MEPEHVNHTLTDIAQEVAIFSTEEQKLLVSVHDFLTGKKLTIATAESCTGGLASFLLTSQPGSSLYFIGGVCCYSNESKVDLLKVPERTIKDHGAVSEETAQAMAIGAQKRFDSNLSLSFTGVAGPDGGSLEKPIGTVWCGLCYNDRVQTKLLSLSGNRHKVRWQASFETLKWLDQILRANFQ